MQRGTRSRGLPRLATLLQEGSVLIHPWVIGELACGTLCNRSSVLELLQGLPAAVVASDSEALQLIEREQLMGRAGESGMGMPSCWRPPS